MASANKMFRLKYSCEEVYERMEKGLCIFCDELDIPGHHQLKHKGIQLLLTECYDDQVSEDKEEAHQETVKNPEPSKETMTNIEPETMKKYDPFIEPLKHASALQVPDSVCDVLLFHKMDSLIKEVGELLQKSTSGNGENVAHQLFDQKPVRVTNKEKHLKHLKGWKFKFKGKNLSRVMPQIGQYKLMERKCKRYNKFSSNIQIEPMRTRISWEHWRAGKQQRISPFQLRYDTRSYLDVFLPIWLRDEIQEKQHIGLSRAERVWKPGELMFLRKQWNWRSNVHNCGIIVNIARRLYGDSIVTMSAKFHETYEEPQFELMCLKQSHDSVENYLGSFGYALTRSSLQATYQYRAPFNPYQNCNDPCHYKREFGNYTGHEIEFDRECEELEDDELKDKQPKEDVETLVMSENTQSLECVDDEFYADENLIKVIAEETAIELVDESGYKVFKERNLNSLLLQEFQIVLLHFKESSDTIVPCRNLDTRVLSSHFFAGGITLLSKMVGAFLLPFLTTNIDSRTICLNSRSIFVDDAAVALRRTVRFVPRMEDIYLESMKQNLEFAIDRGWVEFWTNTHVFTLTNSGSKLSSSKYTKHALILVYHLCSLSSSRLFVKTYAGCIVALLMVYDAERLIQLDAPPIFSDLLCVMNRIRVRLKMVLLVEFLWLILFTSKMFKSSNVHQNKNQVDQKLSSYWKLLLRLLHPLHINRWRSFHLLVIKSLFKGKEESVSFNVAVTSCSSYVKVLELMKDKASRKRKLCKNWWFKYKLNTWLSGALHHTGFVKIIQTFSPMINDTHWDKETWVKLNLESCKGGSLLEFLKRHEARFDMIKVPNNTKFFNYLKFLVKSYILRIEDALKGWKFVKFTMEQSEKPLITILSYEWFDSPRPPELSCCKEDEESTAKITSLRTRMI